jgi:hypothetical protein
MFQSLFFRKTFSICILITTMLCSFFSQAQTVTITGDINTCVGEATTYTPSVVNAALTYQWTVTPPTSGTYLSANSTGANIQWNVAGASVIHLTITDPLNNNVVVYTGNLNVTVHALPSPYISSNVSLACQPLNFDSLHDGQIKPKFDSTHCQLVCANSIVTYTGNGDAGSTFTWTAAGAISVTPIGTGSTCVVNWGATGYGQISVTETTSSGCQASSSFCVQIVESPIAKFMPVPNASPIIVCRDGEVVLMDQSTGSTASPLVSWVWDWGDGDITSTSPGAAGNPVTHHYTHPGNYTLILTVTNSCGCSSSFKRPVTVLDPVAPKIACPRVVCEKEKSTYTIDQPCDAHSWSVIGGTITSATAAQVDVVWDNVDPNTGFGYVSYKSCAPCPMTVTEQIPVILNAAKIQGPAAVCLGTQYVYRLPKWPATEFNWTVSGPAVIQPTDQRNEIALTPTGVGSITLSVKYQNTVLPCGGGASIKINVLPQATISGSSLFCQGTTQSFNVGGASGSWTLRNYNDVVVASGTGTAFSYTFATPGIYRLGVTGTSFCPPADFVVKVVGIPAPPDVILGPDRACPGIPTRYDAGNPVAGTGYIWTVSPGVANAAVGDYSYVKFTSVPGTIFLQRVTLDDAQCVSSAISKTVLDPVPALVITGPDTVCHSTSENYAVNYQDGDLYEWSVATPNLGSIVANNNTYHPTVLWNVPSGVGQTAKLVVKITKCGSPHYDTIPVFIRGLPLITSATVSDDTVCSGTTVFVYISTTFPVGSPTTNCDINWGDGFSTSSNIPAGASMPYAFSHMYNTTGASAATAFTPQISITSPAGCLGTVTGAAPTITVMPIPVALISPSGIVTHCGTGWSQNLFATVTTGIGGSNSYAWSGPSGTPSGSTLSGVNAYGTYSVTVTNSVAGCASTSSMMFIESCPGTGGPGCGTPPTVTLTTDTAACNSFAVHATVGATPVSTGSWSVPIGVTITSSTSTDLTATADVAGIYGITYHANYAPSCQYNTYINVLVPYVAGLKYSLLCNQAGSGYSVKLYDHSTEFPLTPISSHNYYKLTGGTLTYIGSGLTLTVNQAGGVTQQYVEQINGVHGPCYDTISVSTPVFPTVAITSLGGAPNPGCVTDVVFNFTYTTTGSIVGYWWDFDDGSFNAGSFDPMGKVYSNNAVGPRSPSIKVTDQYGCYAVGNTPISIQANPYAGTTSANPNPVCQGNPVTLGYLPTAGSMPSGTYTWYEQQHPLYTTTYPTVNYQVYNPGGYWVRAVGNFGCIVNTALTIASVTVNQVPAVSVMGNANQCVGQAFTLSTQSYGSGYTYTWSGAGAGSGTSLTTTIGSTGTYTYYVTITDVVTGCFRTSPAFTITVSSPPALPSLSYTVLSCNPYELKLNAAGAAGTYNWSNGMSGSTITVPFGGPYQVTLTDLNGCRVQNDFVTPKDPADYLWVFPTGCFCNVQTRKPYVIGPIVPFNYWAWLLNGGVDVSGSGYMSNYYISPGNIYNMYLDDGNCAVTSDDMYFESDTCNHLAVRPGDNNNQAGSLVGVNNATNALQLIPNPAIDQTTIEYNFAISEGKRSIDLIDVTGRVLQSFTITDAKGSIHLQLSKYAAGMYQVAMRRDGIVVEQRKLSLTK